MKNSFFKIALLVCTLAVIAVFNTGCPSSARRVTKGDSTGGSPPQIKKAHSTYSTGDSTGGSPPHH